VQCNQRVGCVSTPVVVESEAPFPDRIVDIAGQSLVRLLEEFGGRRVRCGVRC
jgi:hypothetical protein